MLLERRQLHIQKLQNHSHADSGGDTVLLHFSLLPDSTGEWKRNSNVRCCIM